ncbi:DUF2145 domain-containing protein [Curvibacter sp. RS43]|uniref:DUF2145 domain-containing protein n=1 Tax=Curvibacter microcysteis TaxID=3026419 RepID=UPI0023605B17|nr:DUF2145 domain-containing protein [Curvibacter sp. RS43]MDD0812494.1 DUF2145 domain-containing protein [Curvibacter sp. RS43]
MASVSGAQPPGTEVPPASPPAQSQSQATNALSSAWCSRTPAMTVQQQARLLRFASLVQAELNRQAPGSSTLISRSGLDLARFQIRYSHAALAWQNERGDWLTRQLYYACEEGRPRVYDQGVAGFVLGGNDPELSYIALLTLPEAPGRALRDAALDRPRAVGLLAARYSANAYAFSLAYQNCNQWLAELLAVAWAPLREEGPELRAQAQRWLAQAGYAPTPVAVDSHWLMLASAFIPLVHLNDHPEEDRYARRLRVSLPASLEAFARQQAPGSERVEICQNGRQAVIHRGWPPVAEGCVPGPGDEVVALD